MTYQEAHFNRIWKAALPIYMQKLLPELLVQLHGRKEQQHLEAQQFMYVLCGYEYLKFAELHVVVVFFYFDGIWGQSNDLLI